MLLTILFIILLGGIAWKLLKCGLSLAGGLIKFLVVAALLCACFLVMGVGVLIIAIPVIILLAIHIVRK